MDTVVFVLLDTRDFDVKTRPMNVLQIHASMEHVLTCWQTIGELYSEGLAKHVARLSPPSLTTLGDTLNTMSRMTSFLV